MTVYFLTVLTQLVLLSWIPRKCELQKISQTCVIFFIKTKFWMVTIAFGKVIKTKVTILINLVSPL